MHCVEDCEITPPVEKKRLLDEYLNKKRDNNKNAGVRKVIRKNNCEDIDNHSTIFSVSFFHGAVECMVMTDGSSDENIISKTLLHSMLQASP